MSTQFTNRQWRLPNNENKDKQSNYSMDFDGNQYIDLDNLDFLNTATALTVSFWFKADDALDSYWHTFLANGSLNPVSNLWCGLTRSNWSSVVDGTSIQPTFSLKINGANSIVGGWGGNITTTSPNPLVNGTWYHFCGTWDGSTQKLYIDGQLKGSLSTTGSIDTTTNDTYIGASPNPTSYLFDGSIDAISIFNYALTDGTGGTVNQIAALYGSSSTGIGNPMSLSPKPVAYYPLGDQDAFNGSNYLVPNSSLKDYVFDFDGADEIQVSNQSLGITSQIAISAWVKIPSGSTGGGSPYIQSFIAEDTVAGSNRNWFLGWRGSAYNDFYFFVFHSNGTSTTLYSNVGNINDGEWHHVLATWNGTTETNAFKLYVDNDVTQTTATNTSINSFSTVATLIGAVDSVPKTRFFDGNLSNIQLWDTNLSSTEVETLYNNGSPIQTLANIPQNSNLQGWWKLDASATYDGSNWTIEDSSSNSNDGTSSGMTQANLVQSDLSFTSGYSPYALDFDAASSDYVQINNGSSLTNGFSQLTVSIWANFSSNLSQQQIITKDGSLQRSFNLRKLSNGVNFLVSTDGTSSSQTLFYPSSSITIGEWYHFIGIYDGSKLLLYVNGSLIDDSVSLTGNLPNTTSGFYIGSYDFGNSLTFDGKLSNASVWNTALTSAQVTELYNEGVPSNLNNHSAYSNLVSWWQLGSNTSWVDPYWIALDEKGTNNGQSQNVAAPNNMGENAIVDGVGSYANGLSSGMGGDEVIGDAPYSTANSLSVNMDVEDRTTDTPS